MIQRIQTVYLFFAGLLIFALFFFPLAHHVYVNNVPSMIKVTGIYQDNGSQQMQTQSFTALTIATAVVALVPIVIIFLFRNRKRQANFCYLAMAIIIGYSFWTAQTVKNVVGDIVLGTNNLGIGIFLSCISIFLLIMAMKAIRKDDALVRSADRLR
ncbi:DUF4293 domain-containing protein [Mucilaginibacter ginkgonis]|uniref:DUF4293 domain-containing protein n=1 Tax=Mucilaginibacter ginkgonis TaxID=2682091 RepID=A0A6I4I2Y0_9SPHI|nr:DUF4293 domain-containing protein [Mucilaginibacter ginkgonis]QQL48328.1 DUF4293 domain-containing protein [Mucilaginibacter ginkgonis]